MIKLTNDIVDFKLQNRKIKRIDDYINARTSINFVCLDCNYIWKTRPDDIINKKIGCPNCSGLARLTNEIVDRKLEGRNIKRLSNITNNRERVSFQCLIDGCKFVWLAPPANILNTSKTGCPKCANVAKLTNEIIDQSLINMNIERIDDYKVSRIPINFRCKICLHIWMAKPNNILNERGCPKCKSGKNEMFIFSILKDHKIEFEWQKFIKDIVPVDNGFHVDFYFPQYNTIIEYNGRQHYEPVCFGGIDMNRAQFNLVKQQERDRYVQQFCDQQHIILIWIDGRKYINSKLKNYMIDCIIPEIRK